jgi:RND family efflux transporter MFP subunit
MTQLQNIVARQTVEEAVVKEQETRGRLQSLGMTASDIQHLVANGLTGTQLGQFTLTASQSGAVIEDNFRVGDVVEAGKTLFQIANLSAVWVEAAVSPAIAPQIVGTAARIISGERSYSGKIIQTRETVDEVTRTVGVRVQVDNPNGGLRPGAFVDVELYGDLTPVLNIPAEAVLREAGGRWAVFGVNSDGSFKALPVTVLYTSGDRTAISGVQPGTKLVTSGAFFVMSEAAKASFGEEE